MKVEPEVEPAERAEGSLRGGRGREETGRCLWPGIWCVWLLPRGGKQWGRGRAVALQLFGRDRLEVRLEVRGAPAGRDRGSQFILTTQ